MRPTLGTWLLRFSLIILMILCVKILINLTAIQGTQSLKEQPYMSCDRPCSSIEWPMICRIKLAVKSHSVISRECNQCENNNTICEIPGCVLADGNSRRLLTINRNFPEPIQVCKGDIMVIDVENLLQESSLTFHWHGQRQEETPFMDGVPMITQCPIQSFTTFQYKFRASDAGTHFYQAFSFDKSNNGLAGAFIVRIPDDPHKDLYDYDQKDHVLVISEWGHRSSISTNLNNIDMNLKSVDSILINGLSPVFYKNLLQTFNVEKAKRYRFRLIYTGGLQGCPIIFSIENHEMKVIAFDGKDVLPSNDVTEIKLTRGDRIDIVITANQLASSYFINVSSDLNCNYRVNGSAKLLYKTDENIFSENKLKVLNSEPKMTIKKTIKNLNEIKSINKFNVNLKKAVDKTIYIPIKQTKMLRTSEYLKEYREELLHGIGNLTFTFPTSPLLTQSPPKTANQCNFNQIPDRCKNKDFCECVHVEKVLINDRVELIFINSDKESSYEYHLHGHYFHILGICEFPEISTYNLDDIKVLNEKNLLCRRNFNDPIIKDTISIPPKNVAIVRFITKNPGFWMLRDMNSQGWTRGLDIVLQVGGKYIAAPSNFPKCDNWIGPEFFLI